MIKNMTRKSLAIGSTAALVVAGLVGALPAQAAPGITVEPSKGTSYSMISGEQLDLRVFGNAEFTTGFANLKWEVTNADEATVTIKEPASTSAAAATRPATNATTPGATSAADKFVVAPANISTVTGGNQLGLSVASTVATTLQVRAFIDLNGSGAYEAANDLSANVATVTFVKPADVTTTTVITAPTAGDTAISAKLSFNNVNNEQLEQADIGVFFTKGDGTTLYPTASVTATSLTSNVATYTAANNFVVGQTVTIAGHTNTVYNVTGAIVASSANNFTLAITNGDITSATGLTGVTATSALANSVKSNVAWSATNQFSFTSSAVSALVKDAAVKVQPLYKAAGTPASTDIIGTAATATIAERKAATIVGDAAASTTAKVITAGSAGDTLLNSSFQAKVVVKDGATTPAGVAGAAVTATITSSGLSATAGSEKTLTVNGTTYSNSSLLPGQGSVAKLALTTNASGEAVINFTTAGYAAADTITVSFGTENLTSATLTLTQRAATYTATVRPFFTTTDGAAVAVPVVVYDQFGGVPADKYDVRATFNSGLTGYVAQATTAATVGSNAVAQLAGGKATLSILDNGTGLGVNTYAITVEERLAGNNYGSNVVGTVQTNVHILAAATLVPGSVTSNGTQDATTKVYEIAGTVALSLVDTANYDSVTVLDAAPSAFTGALTAQNITGTVSTASSATVAAVVVPGAAVTLSGAGLQFKDGGAARYQKDSITVIANTSGVYSADVFSNKEGKQTITVTSGGASATVTVVFAQAKDDTGTALVINAPDSVLPGSTLTVTAVLTDKFGNTVTTDSSATAGFNDGTTTPTFSLSSTSPGFQIGSNPTVTDVNGAAKLAYFLGVNDSGTITVTATYDADGTGTAKTAVTVTKTIIIGAASGNVGDYSSWTKKLDDSSAKIYAKNVVGAGKVQFFLNGREIAWVRATSASDRKLLSANGANYMVRTVTFAAGKNVLEVFVDGVRTTRTAYTKR